MFCILSVTCLLMRKAFAFNYYSRLAHVLNDERFCISTVYIIRMSFSSSKYLLTWHYCGSPAWVTVCVCVCVCVPVRSFLPPRSSRPRNIGTYVFTATRKTLLYIIIVIFAENASFRSYGIIRLPRMPLTTSEPQNTDTNGIHAMSAWHYYSRF